MKKTDYGYSYDYSNQKPLHRFNNTNNNTQVLIYKEFNSYVILQKEASGRQQRLKVDETSLNKMLVAFTNYGWEELHA